MKVAFANLGFEYLRNEHKIKKALDNIMNRGDFILGKEEVAFEKEFAQYCGLKYAVGVNSGTDALFLSLLSLGIKKGDEVIVPAFTFIATAMAVSYTGAKPIFVDIDERTYNIDIKKIEKVISKRSKAIIPVHLYGHAVNMEPLLKIARRYNLKVIEDCAQAHGAVYKIKSPCLVGRQEKSKIKEVRVGTLGNIGCFSFYPTKNLGACGDGGIIVTNNKTTYETLLKLRDYGRKGRYEHIILGFNSRLDTIQASILRIKLKNLDRNNDLRRQKASYYNKLLSNIPTVILPQEQPYAKHVYHLYVVRVKNRSKSMAQLSKKGIRTLIHYPIPLPLQKVYKNLNYKEGQFPVAEKVAREILSLPFYPDISFKEIKYVADSLKEIL
jgi:dTDP-4-amino-4,6-dideoxygalactose transaminase